MANGAKQSVVQTLLSIVCPGTTFHRFLYLFILPLSHPFLPQSLPPSFHLSIYYCFPPYLDSYSLFTLAPFWSPPSFPCPNVCTIFFSLLTLFHSSILPSCHSFNLLFAGRLNFHVIHYCDVGDDVLIPAPYWPSYPDMVKMCGARPIIVETLAEDGYVYTSCTLLTLSTEQHALYTVYLFYCRTTKLTNEKTHRIMKGGNWQWQISFLFSLLFLSYVYLPFK